MVRGAKKAVRASREPSAAAAKAPPGGPGFHRATIGDVAKLARVSTTAVSFVLNGRNAGIPETTQKRISEAARELHYRPHGLIRGLKARRTHVVGLFVQDPADMRAPLFSLFVAGLSRGCCQSGYDMLLYRSASPAEELEASLFLDGRIDGLCFWGREDQKALEDLGRLGFPVVSLFDSEAPMSVGAVWANDGAAYSTLLDGLLREGRRQFVFCHGELSNPIHRSRCRAFLETAAKKGIARGQIQTLGPGAASTAPEALRLVEVFGSEATAVFARDDLHAASLIRFAEKAGHRAAEDFPIIGYDNCGSSISGRCVATTRTPIYEIGVRAIAQLDSIISGQAVGSARECLPVEVIEGEAVAPAPRRRLKNLAV